MEKTESESEKGLLWMLHIFYPFAYLPLWWALVFFSYLLLPLMLDQPPKYDTYGCTNCLSHKIAEYLLYPYFLIIVAAVYKSFYKDNKTGKRNLRRQLFTLGYGIFFGLILYFLTTVLGVLGTTWPN